MKLINSTYYILLLIFYSSRMFAQVPQTLWTKTYGGIWKQCGRSVQQTIDGGYIIGGYTETFSGGGYDCYLVKTNEVGDTIWTRTYGGANDDVCYAVDQANDGGYILAGYTTSFGAGLSDVYLIKTSSAGDTMWTKTYGSADREYAYDVQQTSDGGYITTGCTRVLLEDNIYVVKTDSIGDTLWVRTYAVPAGENQIARSIKQTNDGGYIIAFRSWWGNIHIFSCMNLLKLNIHGDSLWYRCLLGWEPFSIQITNDGGYIIAGCELGSSRDFRIVKTDSAGGVQWAIEIGDESTDEIAYSIWETMGGGYIVGGEYNHQFCVARFNHMGDTLWTNSYGQGVAYSIQQTADSGYIVCGDNGSDAYLVRLGSESRIEEKPVAKPLGKSNTYITIFSGPLQLPERKNCRVFDITGRVVAPDKVKPGIYFIEVDGKITQKVIKVR